MPFVVDQFVRCLFEWFSTACWLLLTAFIQSTFLCNCVDNGDIVIGVSIDCDGSWALFRIDDRSVLMAVDRIDGTLMFVTHG